MPQFFPCVVFGRENLPALHNVTILPEIRHFSPSTQTMTFVLNIIKFNIRYYYKMILKSNFAIHKYINILNKWDNYSPNPSHKNTMISNPTYTCNVLLRQCKVFCIINLGWRL